MMKSCRVFSTLLWSFVLNKSFKWVSSWEPGYDDCDPAAKVWLLTCVTVHHGDVVGSKQVQFDVRYKLYLPSETHQRHNENNTIYYQRTLKQLQRRQVPNLSSAASFPVRMESVDVSIVNCFISISSSAARQDIIKCAAWSWVTNLSPKLIFESSCIWSVSWVIVKCFTGNVKWLRELTNYSDVRVV